MKYLRVVYSVLALAAIAYGIPLLQAWRPFSFSDPNWLTTIALTAITVVILVDFALSGFGRSFLIRTLTRSSRSSS